MIIENKNQIIHKERISDVLEQFQINLSDNSKILKGSFLKNQLVKGYQKKIFSNFIQPASQINNFLMKKSKWGDNYDKYEIYIVCLMREFEMKKEQVIQDAKEGIELK